MDDGMWFGIQSVHILFCFFNYCFALDKSWHTAIVSLCWVSGLTSQSTWSTKGFWNSGCCHSWTGKEIHSECFGYWLGLKLCYGLLGFCVMKNLFFCQFELVFHTASFTSCSCMSSGMNEVFKLILKKYPAWAQCGSVPKCQSHIGALEHTGKYFGQTDFLMFLQNLRNAFNTFFLIPFSFILHLLIL